MADDNPISFVFARLKAPFPDVRTRQGRAGMTYQFINAQQVMDRLDEALGPENWDDKYQVIDTCVYCEITITLPGGEVIRRGDGSGYDLRGDGETKDRKNSDVKKAAFSDAFKRAAKKFGVGRYLTGSGQSSARRPAAGTDPNPTRTDLTTRYPTRPAAPSAEPTARDFPSRVPPLGPRPGAKLFRKYANHPYGGTWVNELNSFGAEKNPPWPELVKNWTEEQCAEFDKHANALIEQSRREYQENAAQAAEYNRTGRRLTDDFNHAS